LNNYNYNKVFIKLQQSILLRINNVIKYILSRYYY